MFIFEYLIIGFYMFSALFHLFFYLSQKSYNEHIYYSFFIFSICLTFILRNSLMPADYNAELLNVSSIMIMFLNAVAFSMFCYSLFDLSRIKTYMIISLSFTFILCIISMIFYQIKKDYIYQILIFYSPLSLGLLIFIVFILYYFFKLKQYKEKQKTYFLISVFLFMTTQIPISIIKWSINQDNNHIFLFAAVPIMILFEIGLINNFKNTERKIRSLEREIAKLENDKSFELVFNNKCDNSSMTDREKQITRLLIEGKEAKEISNELDIAYNTVRNFKQKIYFKLNVKNTIELLNAFIK
jgi:DNA-binding CsgD family transcriptional regulator